VCVAGLCLPALDPHRTGGSPPAGGHTPLLSQWGIRPSSGEPHQEWGKPTLGRAKSHPGGRNPSPGRTKQPGSPTGWPQQWGPRTPTRGWGHVIPCPSPRRGVGARDGVSEPATGCPSPRRGVRGCRSAWVGRRHRSGVRTPTRGLGHVIPCPRARRGVRTPDVVLDPPDVVSEPRRGARPPRRGVRTAELVSGAIGPVEIRGRRRRAWCTNGQDVSARNGSGPGPLSVAIGRGGGHVLSVGTPNPGKRASSPLRGNKFADTDEKFPPSGETSHLGAPMLGNPAESTCRLTRPRGIRVAASFPGRGGGCQGS
jgi:hypothetical protein